MSLFPISKRLTFFLDYFVYAVFNVHVRSTSVELLTDALSVIRKLNFRSIL